MDNNLNGIKVFVTGAGGFIGSHLVESLANRGASVRAFVRYNSRADTGFLNQLDPDLIENLDIVFGDLRDPQSVSMAVKGCQIIFHLGALISIPYSYHHPREVVETNILGTLNILQASLENQADRLVHTSTSEVYGTALYAPIDEEHPLQGQSPYSASKIGADKLAESFYCSYNLPVVTVRPFNTFGPRQSARAVIPTIITQALSKDMIKLGSLETRRDFTYVSDTVNGFIKAAFAEQAVGHTINLGTGREITIHDLANTIIQITGRQVEIRFDADRTRPGKSEVMRLQSNNHLASQLMGWEPEVSLEDGLIKTIDWIRTHLNGYRVGTYEF
jgi:NAD dependent epimerase/dehydratase